MLAQIDVGSFHRFARAHRLSCEIDKPQRYTCIRVVADCSSIGSARRGFPADLFQDFSIPRDASMDGCRGLSIAQWSKGRMIAIDHAYQPYY